MTKSWVALLLAGLLGCDGGSAGAPVAKPDGAAGSPDAAPGNLDAAPAPITFGRITLTSTSGPGGLMPVWVAFNDGDGPWQTVDGAGGVYSFEVSRGRFGLAFVCEPVSGTFLGEVVHATVAELSSLTVDCGPSPAPFTNYQLSGPIRNLDPAVTSVELQAATPKYTYSLGQAAAPDWMYKSDLPAEGPYDVLALAKIGGRARRAYFYRALEMKRDTVLSFDFGIGVDTALHEQPLNLIGDAASAPGTFAAVSLFTAKGVFQITDPPGPLSRIYYAFPVSQLRPGDTQTLEVGSSTSPTPPLSLRGVVLGFREPKPLEVQLPPEFTSAQVTAAATAPTLRPRMSFAPYPGARFYQLSVSHFAAVFATHWLAIFSAAWLDGQTSYDFPDFSGARGYDDDYGFDPSAELDYGCDAVTSTRDFGRTINDDAATRAGARMTYARKVARGRIR
jgi:hypothetical protein